MLHVLGDEQGSRQPVTHPFTSRLNALLGGLLPRPTEMREPVADSPSQPPVPIRSVADLATAPLQRAWTQLETKRGDRPFLGRADIDPAEFKPLLPSTALVEIHGDPPRFRVRLAGTEWRAALGFEPTGLWLHEWPNASQRSLLETAWTAALMGRCAMRVRRYAIVDHVALHYEAIIVPLAADGRIVNMLLTMSAPWRVAAPPATTARGFSDD
jgi:hypothetical protein